MAKRAGDRNGAEEYYQRASSLTRSSEERETASQALAEVRQPGGGYAFKNAESIARSLKLSEDAKRSSTRAFAAAEPVNEDFYESSQGLAVNLSIIFRVNSAELTAQGMKQLDEVGRALQGARQQIRFRVEGFSSSEGAQDVNLALSKARASSVRDYLTSRYGIASARLTAVGRGSSSPVIENGRENREKSRRVTMIRLYDQ